MKYAIALMLAGSMLFCSKSEAKKVPPPAPNLAAAISANMEVYGEVIPPSTQPLYDVNTNISLSHSFTITPEQEAALQADTVVYVMFTDVTLGNDPNFENGDKSASFDVNLPMFGFFEIEVPCKVSLKWNNGKMSVSIKGKLKEKDLPMEVVEARLKAIKEREAYPVPVVTEIVYSSMSPLEVVAPLACDVEMSQTMGATAEGTEFMRMGQTVKSKGFSSMPMPEL